LSILAPPTWFTCSPARLLRLPLQSSVGARWPWTYDTWLTGSELASSTRVTPSKRWSEPRRASREAASLGSVPSTSRDAERAFIFLDARRGGRSSSARLRAARTSPSWASTCVGRVPFRSEWTWTSTRVEEGPFPRGLMRNGGRGGRVRSRGVGFYVASELAAGRRGRVRRDADGGRAAEEGEREEELHDACASGAVRYGAADSAVEAEGGGSLLCYRA